MPRQAGKYEINIGHIKNFKTKEIIPKREPIFILRGQDKHAVHTLIAYMEACETPEQKEGVSRRLAEFATYALECDIKEPTP